MKSEIIKGYLFALLATLAFSNVYIFSKAALNEIHLAQFGLYWFIIGFTLNFLYAAKKKKLPVILKLNKRQYRILLFLGALEILTTTTFFTAINIIPDPSITSFLGNMYPVLLTVFGVAFLKERFTSFESIGVFLALAGAFIISYAGGDSLSSLFIPGTGIILVNATLAATSSIIVKKHVVKISPEIITLNRTFWLLIFSIVMFFVLKESFVIPISAFKNIVVGAILGPFLGILTVYYSFKYIEASRSSIVQSLKGIFVLIGAIIVFNTMPLTHQLIGGFLTVMGVFIMTYSQARMKRGNR